MNDIMNVNKNKQKLNNIFLTVPGCKLHVSFSTYFNICFLLFLAPAGGGEGSFSNPALYLLNLT